MTMNEKKYKRLEYLRHNINYLTIRERQEYYDLLNELKKAGMITTIIVNMNIPIMNQKAFKKILPLLMVEMLVEEIREKVFQIKKTTEINHQKKKVNLLKKLNLARRKNVTG